MCYCTPPCRKNGTAPIPIVRRDEQTPTHMGKKIPFRVTEKNWPGVLRISNKDGARAPDTLKIQASLKVLYVCGESLYTPA